MDTFVDSSWYQFAYTSPYDKRAPFERMLADKWTPVDQYTGGIDHATMHLLYTRFFHKAMRDAGIVRGNEPMLQMRNQGIILGEDGEKMSKSRGNVVPPDELVARHGADALRAYLMFAYRWQEGGPWNSSGIEGTSRWLRRTWALFTGRAGSGAASAGPDILRALRRKLHQTLKSVSRDFGDFEFNTIVSSLMELLNEMYKARDAGAEGSAEWQEAMDYYVRMLAPVCPHIAEELWTKRLGKPYSVHQQPWPRLDEAAAQEDVIDIPVQVNGKVRDRIRVAADASEDVIRSAAVASEIVKKYLEGRQPRKVIVVQKRLVSLVV
jgi:leucyl-tRNA synthetase